MVVVMDASVLHLFFMQLHLITMQLHLVCIRFAPSLFALLPPCAGRCRPLFRDHFGLCHHLVCFEVVEAILPLLEELREEELHRCSFFRGEGPANPLQTLQVHRQWSPRRIVVVQKPPVIAVLHEGQVDGIPGIVPREKWIPLIRHASPSRPNRKAPRSPGALRCYSSSIVTYTPGFSP